MELMTLEGKAINLKKAYIEVSKCKGGEYYFSLQMSGTLPKCRKIETLTYSFGHKRFLVTTLFGYRKHYSVDPNTMLNFIKTLPIVNRYFFPEDKIVITPELEKQAREHVEGICSCPAIKGF